MRVLTPLFGCVVLRALDILSEEVLVELSAAYRRAVSFIPALHAVCSLGLLLDR